MGFLDNFLGKININGEDGDEDYGYDDPEETEDEEEDASAKAAKPAEGEETTAPAVTTRKKTSKASAGKVVPMHSASVSKQSEVCMILPKGYENSSEIAEILLQGKTVVLNMEGMNIDAAQRIIDFTSGACFTMGGNLQKISKKIFIATPSSVELSGDFSNLFGEDVDMSNLNLTV